MFIENQFCARNWVKPLPSGASQDIRKQIHVFNACDNCDKVIYEEQVPYAAFGVEGTQYQRRTYKKVILDSSLKR